MASHADVIHADGFQIPDTIYRTVMSKEIAPGRDDPG